MNPILHVVISVWFNLVCGIPDKTINIHSFFIRISKSEWFSLKLGNLLKNSLLIVQTIMSIPREIAQHDRSN